MSSARILLNFTVRTREKNIRGADDARFVGRVNFRTENQTPREVTRPYHNFCVYYVLIIVVFRHSVATRWAGSAFYLWKMKWKNTRRRQISQILRKLVYFHKRRSSLLIYIKTQIKLIFYLRYFLGAVFSRKKIFRQPTRYPCRAVFMSIFIKIYKYMKCSLYVFINIQKVCISI